MSTVSLAGLISIVDEYTLGKQAATVHNVGGYGGLTGGGTGNSNLARFSHVVAEVLRLVIFDTHTLAIFSS